MDNASNERQNAKTKIVGMGVCGPNEADRYLKNTLEEFKRLCDDVIICCNNAGEKEKKMIKEYDFWQYDDSREWGKLQYALKTDLLKRVAKLKPDWILPLDMDEIPDKNFTREAAEELAHKGPMSYYFAVINLWNDEDHYRHDLSFWNIRYFRFLPEYGLEFERKNLHCGLAPSIFYKYGAHAPYILKHYGLMLPEERAEKVERYDKYDPNAKWIARQYYENLKTNGNVGPFDEDKMHERIVRDVQTYFKDESKKYYDRVSANKRRS